MITRNGFAILVVQGLLGGGIAAQVPGKTLVAKPAVTKAYFTAPPPQVRSIGGSPTTTTLTWVAADTRTRLLQFEVSRWHQAASCCNSAVVIPADQSDDGKWTDYDFPLSGVYVYRIISVYADGTRGMIQIDYPRPDPVNPASLAASPLGQNVVQLTWPAVPQVSFYQVWGDGIPGTGITVTNDATPAPGKSQVSYDGVPHFALNVPGISSGTHQWSVGSFYVPPTCPSVPAGQPCPNVSTAATAFTQRTVYIR